MKLWPVSKLAPSSAYAPALPLIARACARPDADMSAEQILSLCADPARPDWMLWLLTRGRELVAALASQFEEEPGEPKRIVLVACGGSELSAFPECARDIEEMGRINGCAVSRIEGRKGWARVLGYSVIGRNGRGGWIMERAL